MSRTVLLFVALLAYCVFLSCSAHAGTQKKLRLVVPLYTEDGQLEPGYVVQLNQYLKDDDIIAVRGKPAIRSLIKEIKKGKVTIVRQSLADLEKDIKFMNSEGIKLDYICYNPEGWRTSHTPAKELNDIVQAVKDAKSLASRYGANLIVVPDHTVFSMTPRMAQFADIFAFQFQRWQLLSDRDFRDKVMEVVRKIREVNPSVPVIAQLSTNPPTGKKKMDGRKEYAPVTSDAIISKVEAIRDLVDGIGFLLFREDDGLGRFKDFLKKSSQIE